MTAATSVLAATSARLVGVDGLRGVAALTVLASHLQFTWSATPQDPAGALAIPSSVTAVTDFGRFGVHLFLVISGFAIHMRLARAGGPAPDFLGFWRRRLRRLYPPYFAALVLSVVGVLVLWRLTSQPLSSEAFGRADAWQVAFDLLLLLLLLQNLNLAGERVGNGPFWTLALEEQLYLLYFPMASLRRRVGWTGTLLVVAGVTAAWRATGLLVGGADAPEFWYIVGPARWLEWVLGAIAVERYVGAVTLPAWCASPRWGVILIALAVLVNVPGVLAAVPALLVVSDAAFGLAFFVWINVLCDLERSGTLRRSAPWSRLAQVGLFSYSLYLVHTPGLSLAKQFGLRLGLSPGLLGTAMMVALRVLIPIALGYLFFRLVEVHFLRRPVATTTRFAASSV